MSERACAAGRRRLLAFTVSLATGLVPLAVSFAQEAPLRGAGGALQLLEQLEAVRAEVKAFTEFTWLIQFEEKYCLPPDNPNKVQDRELLAAREKVLGAYQFRYRTLKRRLIDLITNDAIALRAVERKFPDANAAADAFWKPWETAFEEARRAIMAKRAELEGKPEVSCRSALEPQGPGVPPPPQGPGVDLPAVTERPVEIPPIPPRFCSAGEKQAVLDAFRAVSWDFYLNYQDAREYHDAIASALEDGRGNAGVLRAMLPEAKAKLDHHAKRFDEFSAAYERASAMPVEDCGPSPQPRPDPPPPEDPITQPRYEFFVFPEVPAVFCTEAEKAAVIQGLKSAADAARRNYDKAAAMVVELADRIAKGDQSAATSAAFQEASGAASKWINQARELDASLRRAEAMPIIDCTPAAEERRTALNDATVVNPSDVAVAPLDPTSQRYASESPGGAVPGAGSEQETELAEVLRNALFSGPSAEPVSRAAEVELYFLALGGSTGPVVQLFAVNRSGEAVRLPADFLVLEPVRISPEAQARIGTLLQGIVDRGGRPRVLDAYCLEFLRQPPAAGTVLRMANASTTQRFAQAKRVLETAKRLRDLGRLTPDSDPEEYFHAIRQWAIWTVEQRFDARRFTDAFVRTTRKNYESAGDKWTGEIERALRAVAPNRWKDIQAVLTEAGLP